MRVGGIKWWYRHRHLWCHRCHHHHHHLFRCLRRRRHRLLIHRFLHLRIVVQHVPYAENVFHVRGHYSDIWLICIIRANDVIIVSIVDDRTGRGIVWLVIVVNIMENRNLYLINFYLFMLNIYKYLMFCINYC